MPYGQSSEELAHPFRIECSRSDKMEILYRPETITTIDALGRRLVTRTQGLGTYDLYTAAVFETSTG